jgi:hypothetical protein
MRALKLTPTTYRSSSACPAQERCYPQGPYNEHLVHHQATSRGMDR